MIAINCCQIPCYKPKCKYHSHFCFRCRKVTKKRIPWNRRGDCQGLIYDSCFGSWVGDFSSFFRLCLGLFSVVTKVSFNCIKDLTKIAPLLEFYSSFSKCIKTQPKPGVSVWPPPTKLPQSFCSHPTTTVYLGLKRGTLCVSFVIICSGIFIRKLSVLQF